jgi:flagellar biosynthetic protein FliR
MAFMITAPLLSRSGIPVMVRIGIGGVLVLAIYQTILDGSKNLILTDPANLSIGLFHELMIGVFMGFIMNLFFDALVTFSHVAGIQMGQSASNVFNPAIESATSPTATFMANTALMFFVLMNGFYHLVFLLKKSFVIIPIASYSVNLTIFTDSYLSVFNEIFITALKIVLPLIAVMAILDIFVALFAKIMPQANMFFLLMPAKLVFGVFILAMMLEGVGLQTEDFFTTEIWEHLDKLLTG